MRSSKEEEFLRAYEEFADAIFRHCYFRISDREVAKDLTQETFTRTWKYIVDGEAPEMEIIKVIKILESYYIDSVELAG